MINNSNQEISDQRNYFEERVPRNLESQQLPVVNLQRQNQHPQSLISPKLGFILSPSFFLAKTLEENAQSFPQTPKDFSFLISDDGTFSNFKKSLDNSRIINDLNEDSLSNIQMTENVPLKNQAKTPLEITGQWSDNNMMKDCSSRQNSQQIIIPKSNESGHILPNDQHLDIRQEGILNEESKEILRSRPVGRPQKCEFSQKKPQIYKAVFRKFCTLILENEEVKDHVKQKYSDDRNFNMLLTKILQGRGRNTEVKHRSSLVYKVCHKSCIDFKLEFLKSQFGVLFYYASDYIKDEFEQKGKTELVEIVGRFVDYTTRNNNNSNLLI